MAATNVCFISIEISYTRMQILGVASTRIAWDFDPELSNFETLRSCRKRQDRFFFI